MEIWTQWRKFGGTRGLYNGNEIQPVRQQFLSVRSELRLMADADTGRLWLYDFTVRRSITLKVR